MFVRTRDDQARVACVSPRRVIVRRFCRFALSRLIAVNVHARAFGATRRSNEINYSHAWLLSATDRDERTHDTSTHDARATMRRAPFNPAPYISVGLVSKETYKTCGFGI